MHAVIVRVTISDVEAATEQLRNEIVPRVKQAPGFVAGYWIRTEGDDKGRGLIVFDSVDAARAAAEQLRAPRGKGATLDYVDVAEVVEAA
jgi:hypothetical protein